MMSKAEILEMERWAAENDALIIHTIYFNTTDYPGKYVVRDHAVLKGGKQGVAPKPRVVGRTLEEVRQTIPWGKVLMQRHEQDDPVIVETWM